MTKQTWNDIVQDWRGKGTIHATRIEGRPDGKFRLHYEDGGNPQHVDWDSEEECGAALVEFGGKNEFTVKAPDEFLSINGWKGSNMLVLGHKPVKIHISGNKTIQSDVKPIAVPPDCGQPEKQIAVRKGKKKQFDTITLHQRSEEKLFNTRSFQLIDEFDNYISYLKTAFQNYEWQIRALTTYACGTKALCEWQRIKAGDNSKRMELKMVRLNGKKVEECVKMDIIRAADGMVGGECSLIDVKAKKPPAPEHLCVTNAEATLDPNKYEAVTPKKKRAAA